MTHPDPHSQYSHHYTSLHRQGDPIYYREASTRSANRRSAPAPLHRESSHMFSEQPKRRKKVKRRPRSRNHMLLAGGGMLALAAMVVVPKPVPESTSSVNNVCQQKIESQSVLSRAELSQLLSVPERSSKEAVQQVIAAPYCTLAPITVREGAIAQREAYPLAFDPQTWLIVLYEEGEYAGYDFSFRRE